MGYKSARSADVYELRYHSLPRQGANTAPVFDAAEVSGVVVESANLVTELDLSIITV